MKLFIASLFMFLREKMLSCLFPNEWFVRTLVDDISSAINMFAKETAIFVPIAVPIMSLSISLRTASYQLSLLYLWADKNDQPLKDCYEVIEIHNYTIKRLFIAVRELHSSVGLTRVRAYFVRSFTSFLLVSFLVYLFHFDATYEISWQRSFKLL